MDTSGMESPEVLASDEIYKGRVFDVTLDTVREGEKTYQREVVWHNGSAVIVAVDDQNRVALVRQYRHPAVRYLLELPAGSLNARERPEEGAARELTEEVGVTADRFEKLIEFFVSPGFCSEKMWIYLATGLHQAEQRLEDDEMVDVVRTPIMRALEMIESGEIQDAKTIIGLMLALQRLSPPLM